MSNGLKQEETKQEKLTRLEKISLRVNIGALIILSAILYLALSQTNLTPVTFFLLALGAGGLGGLIHEFAQSGGKILFIQKFDDGFYLGSLSGIIMGFVAGILILQNQLTSGGPVESTNLTKAAIEAFFAGLGLKGVTEAATSERMPATSESQKVQSKPLEAQPPSNS